MATTITVQEVPAGRSRVLDPSQTQLFVNELARVQGPFWFRIIRRILQLLTFPSSKMRRIQADYLIQIDTNGRIRNYELESGVVLRLQHTSIRYQFYFGLMLTSWMEQ